MTIADAVRGSGRSRTGLAWAAPVAVAGVVVGGVILTTAGSSSASPVLPARTAAQLLVDVQRSSTTALSGTVRESANLGLPSLPGGETGASLSWQSFVTGTHQTRVWVRGRDKQRVAVLGELSEADVTRNGRNVWTYVSDTNTVTHAVLPGRTVRQSRPAASEYTPAEVAAHALHAVTPSTSVTVDASRMVAGHAAYTLVLRPRDTRSTVRAVTIAVDAHRYVPLQVQVFGAGSAPAFEIGFTSISFSTPPDSIFSFRRPAGSIMSTDPAGSPGTVGGDRHRVAPAGAKHPSAPKLIGSGWTSVLELRGGMAAGQATGLLGELTSRVGNSAARLLHTALVNAVLLPDGRVFVGAVRPTVLEHIAASTPR